MQARGSKLGRFDLLPKIHKGLSDVVGRPVISNCGTATEHISEYLDFHLNPLVSKSKSFVKDTNHFLSLAKLREIPDNALLVQRMLWASTLIFHMVKVWRRCVKPWTQGRIRQFVRVIS